MGKLLMMCLEEDIMISAIFHVFGCLVFIHNHKDHLGKFDEKADDGFYLGYSLVAKAFRGSKRHAMAALRNPSQSTRNDDYLPYVLAFDPLSTNNIIINDSVIPTTLNINSSNESHEFSIADDHPVQDEPDYFEPVENHNDTSETQNITSDDNPISEPHPGVTIRSRLRDSEAASANECLYVNFLSEIKPKKVIEALEEEEGWVIPMQEELKQFERNKV
ncbi:hypothetical protein Tco_1439004 [Tanacetum coccineum]